jgi:hypothetical protein
MTMLMRMSASPATGQNLVRENVSQRQKNMKDQETFDPAAEFADAFPIYTAARQNLLQGDFLASARETAWLYVMGSKSSPTGLAEVSTKDRQGNSRLKFTSRYPDDLAKEILNVIADAEAAVQEGADYDLRILRAPTLSLLAVWLYGSRQLIFLVRSSKTLAHRHIVTEEELVKALQPLAESRMEPSDLPATMK